MQATLLHGARDVRFEDRPEPAIIEPTDAIISLPATCICGSDLWPYRGIQSVAEPAPMGHEYCGIVEEIGRGVSSLERGQFRDRLVFRIGQHVPALPARVPDLLPATDAGCWCAGTAFTSAAG